MQARWILSIVPCIALIAACGGQQEIVESPPSPEPAATEDAAEPEAPDVATDGEDTDDADAEPEEEAKPSRPSAAEVLTTEDVAFAFDYNASAMKEAHEKKCEPMSKGDPGLLASCVQNQRKDFHADVLWFRKEPDSDAMVWLVYKRQGDKLSEMFRSNFVFEDEKQESVTLKLVGQAKGSQQIFAGRRSIPVGVPTKYGLVIDDPKYGELKYNSKVGLVAAQNQQ